MTPALLEKIEEYASKRLSEEISSDLEYHNLKHTQEVVEVVKELGELVGLNEIEQQLVQAAAWFHDLGYINSFKKHEEESVKIVKEFLKKEEVSDEEISSIVKCILATEMPQTPQTLMEQVMCDADLSKLAKKSYYKRGLLLKQEWVNVGEMEEPESEVDWIEGSIEFLRNHHFHTPYAIKNWTPGKIKNIERLTLKAKELKEKPVKKTFGRGVETMFRTSSRNHIQLSAIADNKASLMLSINAIIISVVVSVLVPSLDSNAKLVIPTIMLLAVCVLSIVFATISTIPKVTQGTFTKQDITDKKANLLFFGNFHSVPLEDFEYGINELMQDQDFLYSSMSRDLYFLGKVLNQKYRYLRVCYGVFMFGLIASVIAFIVSFFTS